ncbi:MAG: serine hydrolase [Candidatus Eiseniibacteriota bacterium]|nr:MAG: serine hydrolase [Candidatus Eisenbacteria bacterium]
MLKLSLAFVILVVLTLVPWCAPPQGLEATGRTMAAAEQAPASFAWERSTPEEQGMDSERLADMVETIKKHGHRIRSVTVIRNGLMVADATFAPFQPDTWHIVHSCTKSIMSALIGIAIEEGHIGSVETPLLDFFPEKVPATPDERKRGITLKHLLSMSAGLRTEDSYLYRWRGLRELGESSDWIQHIIDLPMSEAPGTRFEYSNCVAFLLAAILQKTTGSSALSFAKEHLFGPLGITEVDWRFGPQGINLGWSGISMKPHDIAKIGLLYLNEGRWGGEQVVPEEWVEESTKSQIHSGTLSDKYGYQWWIDDAGYFMMLGSGGQFVIVHPGKNMVVVFLSVLESDDFFTPEMLFRNFVVPAAVSSDPLPANPKGVARLEALSEAVAATAAEAVAQLPEAAGRVSGRTYAFDPNPVGFKKFCLIFEPGKSEAQLAVSFGPKNVQVSLGLDNVHRITRSEGFLRAYRGYWKDERTFIIDYEVIDYTERGGARLTFGGDSVTVMIEDVIEGESHELIGRLQD